jgi:hypothetical protein
MRAFPQLGSNDIEHGESRATRWLRERWLTVAAGLAIAEGIFIVTGALSKWIAAFVAVALLFAYFTNRGDLRPASLRIGARTIATSQALVLFVPVLVGILYIGAIVVLAVIAVIALAALLRGR